MPREQMKPYFFWFGYAEPVGWQSHACEEQYLGEARFFKTNLNVEELPNNLPYIFSIRRGKTWSIIARGVGTEFFLGLGGVSSQLYHQYDYDPFIFLAQFDFSSVKLCENAPSIVELEFIKNVVNANPYEWVGALNPADIRIYSPEVEPSYLYMAHSMFHKYSGKRRKEDYYSLLPRQVRNGLAPNGSFVLDSSGEEVYELQNAYPFFRQDGKVPLITGVKSRGRIASNESEEDRVEKVKERLTVELSEASKRQFHSFKHELERLDQKLSEISEKWSNHADELEGVEVRIVSLEEKISTESKPVEEPKDEGSSQQDISESLSEVQEQILSLQTHVSLINKRSSHSLSRISWSTVLVSVCVNCLFLLALVGGYSTLTSKTKKRQKKLSQNKHRPQPLLNSGRRELTRIQVDRKVFGESKVREDTTAASNRKEPNPNLREKPPEVESTTGDGGDDDDSDGDDDDESDGSDTSNRSSDSGTGNVDDGRNDPEPKSVTSQKRLISSGITPSRKVSIVKKRKKRAKGKKPKPLKKRGKVLSP